MRRGAGLALAVVTIVAAGAGCAASGNHSAYEPSAEERIQTICGRLKVRLEAILEHTVLLAGTPPHPPASYYQRQFEQGARESADSVSHLAAEARAIPLDASKRYLHKLLGSLLQSSASEFSGFEASTRDDFPYRGGSPRPPKRALNEYDGLVLSALLACRKALP